MKKTILAILLLIVFASCENLNDLSSKKDVKLKSLIGSNYLFYFYKGSTNNNIYYGKSSNGTSWGSTQVNSATSGDGPAAVQFNNRIYVFHKGSTNNSLYVTSSADGINWSTDNTLGNGIASALEPSAAILNGKMFIAYRSNSNNNVFYCSSSSDGVTWVENQIVGFNTTEKPFIFNHNNKVCISFVNNSDFIIISSADGISWEQEYSNQFGMATHSTMVDDNGRTWIAYTFIEDGRLVVMHTNDGTFTNWLPGQSVTTASGANASTDHRPSINWDYVNNHVVIVYKGKTNNNIYYADDRSGTVKEQGLANGSTTASPYLITLH